MSKLIHSNITFTAPVIGIDPITKGTFTIDWAWLLQNFWWDDENAPTRLEAKGSFIISGADNPLYNIVKDTPLRLQEIMGSVDFGHEKRFIQIKSIGQFEIYKERNEIYLS